MRRISLRPAGAQQIRTPRQVPFPVNPDFSKLQVQTLKVQGSIYLVAGAGGNIAAQVGDEGVLLVDTGYEQMSGKVLEARSAKSRTNQSGPSSIRLLQMTIPAVTAR